MWGDGRLQRRAHAPSACPHSLAPLAALQLAYFFPCPPLPCLACCLPPSSPFQDGCIECPATGSTFNLKTGEIMSWYAHLAFRRERPGRDHTEPTKGMY